MLVESCHPLQVRYLDALPAADPLARQQRGHAADEGMHARLQQRVQPGSWQGFTVRLARQIHVPTDGVVREDV